MPTSARPPAPAARAQELSVDEAILNTWGDDAGEYLRLDATRGKPRTRRRFRREQAALHKLRPAGFDD